MGSAAQQMKSSRRHSTVMLLLSLFASPMSLWAEERIGHLIFGSWMNPDFARTAHAQLSRDLEIDIRMTAVEVSAQRYYRVHSEIMAESQARALMDSPAFPDAWFAEDRTEAAQRAMVALRSTARLKDVSSSPSGHPTKKVPGAKSTGIDGGSARSDTGAQGGSIPVGVTFGSGGQNLASTDPVATATPPGATIEVSFLKDADIKIDGHVDEAVWATLPVHDNMRVIDPDSLAKPDFETHTRLFFTNRGLYVSAVMEQPSNTLVARLSSRDQFLNRDAYGITIDTSGQGLYGYWFKVNLGGSLMDGRVLPERTFSEQWDGPWRGASQRTDTGWSAEMFLPWSMMALTQGVEDRQIGIWVERKVAHKDELYGWPALPFTEPRFMSALQPAALPNLKAQSQLAVFPYVSATHDAITDDDEYRVGADIAWRPTPNAQLTATLNPDFGAVESDEVVVNLTAFETFFPEKRLFFLEGTEVFVTTPRSDLKRFRSTRDGGGARPTPKTFVPEPTTLLNTRRIGGPPRQLDVPDGIEVDGVELGKPTDLLGAVKSTGSIGNIRYGFLGAFEDDVELPGRISATGERVKVTAPGRDFGVVRAIYEGTGQSRRSLGYMGTLVTLPEDDSTAHSIDAHYLSPKGRVKIDTQVMMSDARGLTGYGMLADMVYTQRRGLTHFFSFDYIDDQFNVSDLGFIRQNDIWSGQYGLTRQAGGQPGDRFRWIRNAFFFNAQTNVDGFLTRAGIFTNQTFLLRNNNQIRFEIDYYPERWDDINSRGNGMYKTDGRWFTQIGYGTDSSKRFAWSGTLTAEQEELEGNWTYASDLGLTYTPTDNLTFELDVTFKKRDGWLLYRNGRNLTTYAANDLQPRLSVDYFMSSKHQLRLTMQWAGIKAEAQDYWSIPLSEGDLIPRLLNPGDADEDFSLSRLTAQLRYRWEIGPLSDLFVVYTRGSNLALANDEAPFGTLFSTAIDDPILDFLVLKLRYRFGR